MELVGRVESLWRYPVKGMCGEELQQAFLGFAGVYGDRFFAFRNSAGRKGFPYLNGTMKPEMLLYRPVYRDTEQMVKPPNLVEADAIAPGVTPVYPDPEHLAVDVGTPSGEALAVDDPALIKMLREGLRDDHELTLVRSHRAMTDCRPISLISSQTIRQMSQDLGTDLDKRQFRANIYATLESDRGFGEEEFVGHRLRIGDKAMIAVVDLDPRCKIMTLDPNTGEANPEIMRWLSRTHSGNAGVYAVVLIEGTIRAGDEIVKVD